MASGKRCHYEVLGLPRDCTPEEIRSAYKKLALQRHPDKLVQSGLSQADATAQFQELAHAYEVLSDPKERAFYDSHRAQILFSDPTPSANSVPDWVIPNLYSYCSNTVYSGYGDTRKGFYKVYSDVFGKIYANEVSYCTKLGLRLDNVREAPVMGNLESPYGQTTAFYNYWLGFATVMEFFWADRYHVMAGQTRKSRRVLEEENNKLRRKARREYNDMVRGLAAFVKKRDKRVIDMMVKRHAEMEKKKAEEKERKKKIEREKMERARAYEEPEWARVNEEELEGVAGFEEEEEEEKKGSDGGEKEELYCVVCGKKFKSEKQWKNHEQSKKHKEKVAELRESFGDEEEEEEEEEERESLEEGGEGKNEEVEDIVDEIEDRLKEGCRIREEGNGAEATEPIDKEELEDSDVVEGVGEDDVDDGDDNVLKSMASMRKGRGRRNRRWRHWSEDFPQEEDPVEDEKEENEEVMKHDNRKTRRRRAEKQRGKKIVEEVERDDADGNKSPDEETNGLGNQNPEASSSFSFEEHENDDKSHHAAKNRKSSNQSVEKKPASSKETKAKPNKSSKAKKGKAASKNSGNLCDTCGEEFESRNKLHRHLGDTGHASLKFR
ncbi:hypothetical protein Tsubulata_037630 [Turnera subulata]|uniref:J domain-containing protein n=1 Tax=Turnera subulata TaxID=218843 RepID=A0A9Q0F364_9ROSI|nr:hypothetical protein Tsubulata_037630 [Turnera subulata]